MNKLSGNIPDALSSIGGLKQLYLAHNNLSGLIPLGLQNLTFLLKLDLSFNDLQGEVPKGGIFANVTYFSIYGNDQLCGGIPRLHLAPCSMSNAEKKKKEIVKTPCDHPNINQCGYVLSFSSCSYCVDP
jgi:Leucine-rich repeat (LRR) protein